MFLSSVQQYDGRYFFHCFLTTIHHLSIIRLFLSSVFIKGLITLCIYLGWNLHYYKQYTIHFALYLEFTSLPNFIIVTEEYQELFFFLYIFKGSRIFYFYFLLF